MNKSYIKVQLPKDISLASSLQLVEELMNHPLIGNVRIAYRGSLQSKNQELDSLLELRQKYQAIGRMLDAFEKRNPLFSNRKKL